jgi:hypothetical protein
MNRLQILRDHIHPKREEVINNQLITNATNAKSERPNFHNCDHKQILKIINSGDHLSAANILGEKFYNFSHENVISKLHINGCLSITLNRVKHYNALSYGKKNVLSRCFNF